MSAEGDHFIEVDRHGGSDYVVKVHGAVDVQNAARLRAALLAALGVTPTRLVVNLAEVDSIDASGMEVLVGAYRWMTEVGGWLLLEHANADLAGLLVQNGLPIVGLTG
jgi:anti-sigma B factor antagonist